MAKTTQIEKVGTTEIATIPSKEELQIGMRKTIAELEAKLSSLTGPTSRVWKTGMVIVYNPADIESVNKEIIQCLDKLESIK